MAKFKVRTGIAVAFLVLWPQWAQAQFYKSDMGLQQAGFEFGAVKVVARVVVPQPDGGTMSCSGTYISDRRHLLLASHCLERNVFGFSKGAELVAHQIEVDGQVSNWNVRLISACRRKQIVANPMNINLNPITNCEYYDLAILQPQTAMVASGCLSLNEVGAKAQRLVTMGYPARTFRPRELNSLGDGLYFSFGERTESLACTVTKSLDRERVGQSISLAESVRQAKIENALQSSLDVVGGNSGGLVLDVDTGAPFAVVSFASTEGDLDVHRERCEGGAAFITPLAQLERAYQVYQNSSAIKSSWVTLLSELACDQRRQKLIR